MIIRNRFTNEKILETPGTDLRGADLTGAILTGANLTRANLTDAILTRADLTDADLTDAILRNADLTDADLTDANLTRADLTDAILTDADLRDADLTRADLRDADLEGAIFDFSCLPLWCGSLKAHFDDKQCIQILFHLLSSAQFSKNTSDELKKTLLTPEIVELANRFNRTECERLKYEIQFSEN